MERREKKGGEREAGVMKGESMTEKEKGMRRGTVREGGLSTRIEFPGPWNLSGDPRQASG